MKGILLALIGSFLLVFADTGKKKLSATLPTTTVVWSTLLIAFTINVAALIASGIPDFDINAVCKVLPWSIFIVSLGELSFMQALKRADFSLSQPFKAFVPVFGIPVSLVVVGEHPDTATLVGVTLAFIGAYLMFAPQRAAGGVLAPFKSIITEDAPRFMLIAALCGAIFSALQKIGAGASSSLLYYTCILGGQLILFSLLLIIQRGKALEGFITRPLLTISTGILWGVGMSVLWSAVLHTLVVNVLVVTQLQPLLAIPIGALIFREQSFHTRIFPCLVMIAGVVVITLSGN